MFFKLPQDVIRAAAAEWQVSGTYCAGYVIATPTRVTTLLVNNIVETPSAEGSLRHKDWELVMGFTIKSLTSVCQLLFQETNIASILLCKFNQVSIE